ncbi:MAG: methyltransferase [Clostridia bacterium]|nr:methyltransferase [Clostridia bacterium]
MKSIDYLNEQYKIIQDSELYKFTSDSILLSRFVTAQKGETVADFCAGGGVVGLNFFAENTGVSSVTFFEAQEELAALCEESVSLNGLSDKMKVENLRLQDIPAEYTEKFSLILCNPPFENAGFENADPKKASCRKELSLTLEELVISAKRCLKFGGRFVLCHRADRAAEVIYTLHAAGLEPKLMQFVTGRAGREPYLVLISAKKGAKAGVRVLSEKVNVKGE